MTDSRADALVFQEKAKDPIWFLTEVLGLELYDRQVELARAVAEHPQTAVKSCHASGKTFEIGGLALWWVFKHPSSIAIITGPTFRQVQENAWGELTKAYNRARVPLGGKLLKDCRLPLGPRWGVLGFSTDKPERIAGFHAEHVLVIVDEASGVDEALFESLEGLRSAGQQIRVLLLSQGTQSAGTFFNAFHAHRKFWNCITISAFDTPNFDPAVVAEWERAGSPREYTWPRPYLVNPAWATELAEKHGADSDIYRVRVLGEFPKGDPFSLIPLHWVERARLLETAPSRDPQTWMGVDVARFGDDDSAVFVRRGANVLFYEELSGNDTVAVTGWAGDISRRFGVTDINVDVVGVGGGVADMLRHQVSARVHDVNVGASPRDPERFSNLRAEAFWGLRERFESDSVSLRNLAPDVVERLTPELTGIRFRTTPAGKIEIEAKEKFKARLSRSPDAGDALMLAFAQPTDRLLAFVVEDAHRTSVFDADPDVW